MGIKKKDYTPCDPEHHLSHLNLTSNLRTREAGHCIGSHFFQIKAKIIKWKLEIKKLMACFYFNILIIELQLLGYLQQMVIIN